MGASSVGDHPFEVNSPEGVDARRLASKFLRLTAITQEALWRSQRESNPYFSLERAMS